MKTNCVIRIIICGLLMAFVLNVCGMPAEKAGNITQGEVGKEAPPPQKETTVEAPKIVTTTQEAPKASTKEVSTSEETKKEPKALSSDFEDDEASGKVTAAKAAKQPSKGPKDVPPPKAPKETKPAVSPKGQTITEFAKLEGSFGDGDNTTTTSPPITNTTTTPVVTTKEPKKNQADKGIVMNLLNLAIIMTSGRILAM